MTQPNRSQTLSSDLTTALSELVKLTKSLKFYAAGHPALSAAASETCAAFQSLLARHAGQPFQITTTGFFLDQEPLAPQNNTLKQLAVQLNECKVRHLLFLPELSNQELLIFAGLISRPAAELLAAGGLPKLLEKQQLRSIWANATDLAEIQARLAERQDEAGAEEPPQELTDNSTFNNEAILPQESKDVIAWMRDLLELLKEPLNDDEYQQLLEQLLQKAPQFLQASGLPGSLALFSLLLNHNRDEQRSASQRQSAHDGISLLLSDEIKQQLATAVADPSLKPSQKKALGRVLVGLEMQIAPTLLRNLYAERDALIRRKYTGILSHMGEALYALLTDALHDETWHVVRNAVIVLGETRLESALPLLEAPMGYPEVRVRRALIQALSMIGGDQVIPLLVRLSSDPATELQQPAIMALGSLGKAQAIPPLAAILLRFDPLGKQTDLKLEVIRALTILSSPQAILPLLKVARRSNLLRLSRIETLRAEAILALGQLGNPHLIPLLDQLPKSNKGPVSRAIKQATSQLRNQSSAP